MHPRNFFAELQRRNVYRVAMAYAGVAWLLIQVATQVFPFFEIPNWAVRLVVLLLLLGFPVALILAWAFELTPEGIRRVGELPPGDPVTHQRGQKLNFFVIFVLAVAVGVLLFQRWHTSAPKSAADSQDKSIAVLPFESLSKDEENAFFTNGVQDEILADLAKVADLKVISKTSVMQYKSGAQRNLRQIARELGVAHVLEGSVQRINNRVRVTAQLIDARTDAHLWADHYDRELADVFAIQSEIARTIADQLRARISPREKVAMSEVPTSDLEANKLYLQAQELTMGGRAFDDPNAKENMLQAVRLLDEAVSRDPHFIRALCRLCEIHIILYSTGADHTSARRELANAAVQSAIKIRPEAAEVHYALAMYAYHGFRDYDRALAELELARNALPNNAGIYLLIAAVDRRQGRWAESTKNFSRALDLDPLNQNILREAAITYEGLHRYSEAQRVFERWLALNPRNYFCRARLARLAFFQRADLQPLRRELSAILSEEPAAAGKIADYLFWCALLERDSAATTKALATIPPEGLQGRGNFLVPRDWFTGLAKLTFGDPSGARAAFSAARAIQEKTVRDEPDYPSARSVLGMIDAGLGRKEEAVSEGRLACDLVPMSRDAYNAMAHIVNLALIYAWTGEKNLAIEQLASVAQIPNGPTYGDLKLNPQWDALRGDPRFENIVASVALQGDLAPPK